MSKTFFTNIPLVISLLLSMAIATTEVPLWTSVFSLFMLLWKFLHEKRDFPKLSPKITPVLGLAIFIIVYVQHHTIFGQEESTTILLGLTAITILNFETERDLLFLVLLGFLMLVMKSVFSLDFFWTAPALCSFFGLWLTLISNQQVDRGRFVLMTTVRSLPLLFLLFVLFPRLVVFQTNKILSPIAQSGFSEELNPGRFSQVALSDQVVFRVEFYNIEGIQSKDLYWRGAVLNISNNFVWHKGPSERQDLPNSRTPRTMIQYRQVIEPLNMKNIFVLDTPLRIYGTSEPAVEWRQGFYTLPESQQQVVQFTGESTYDGNDGGRGDSIDKAGYLKISELPPRTKEWVEKTKVKFSTPESRIKALNDFFLNPGFAYTLNPDQYRNDLDDFLFVKKRGFCEHFAAAYATMARGLGIPSRVVIGYQGGSYNSLGNFWRVSQKDAHAWVEVGLNGRWLREDPTGLVTPLRISLGAEEYFSLTEFERLYFSKDKKIETKTFSFKRYLNKAISVFENLNYTWTLFLLNYDLQAQLEILKNVRSGWLYLVFAFVAFVIVGNFLLKRHKNLKLQKHALFDLLMKLEFWAQKSGIEIKTNTTPLLLLEKIAMTYPAAQDFVTDFSREYEALVYRPENTKPNRLRLIKKWDAFLKSVKSSKKTGAEKLASRLMSAE